MPHLNKLDKKYANQGLSVIASTFEPIEVVNAFSIHHTEIKYKVYTKSQERGFPTGGGIPKVHIISADGTLAWSGHPSGLSNKKIEGFLQDRIKFFYKKFKGASKTAINNFLKKKYGKAHKYASKNKEKKSGAKNLFLYVNTIGLRQIKYAKKLMTEKEYLKAYRFLNVMKKTWRGTEFAKNAQELSKECKSKKVKKEYDAAKKLEKLVFKMPKKEKDKIRLTNILKKFANKKNYKNTKAAKNALNWVKIFESSWP